MKTSVLYEALLPITRIKPRAGVTKYKMRSHVARDMTMTRTVWMVCLWYIIVIIEVTERISRILLCDTRSLYRVGEHNTKIIFCFL